MNAERAWYWASVGVAVVAAVFLVALVAGLRPGGVPVFLDKSPVAETKQSLRADPQNSALQLQLRQQDVEWRQRLFERMERNRRAAQWLVAGLAVFLLSAHAARVLRRRLPDPKAWGQRRPEPTGAWAILVCWAVLVGGAWLARAPVPATPLATPPATEDAGRYWPAFRGPTGQGVAVSAPTNWVVLWKAAVPLPGMGSPVVWRQRVFLTGAEESSREILAFDARDGRLLWRQAIQTPLSMRVPKVMKDTGYAAPTPVTDGRRVYAIFANGDCAAVTVDGHPVWGRNLGLPENPYGHASSLALFGDRLLVLLAQAGGRSQVLGLDTRSGETVWEAEPAVGASWISPIVVSGRLIVAAAPAVIAYDAASGREAWRFEPITGELAPSPILAGEKLIVVLPGDRMLALTNGAVAWANDEAAPDIASPVSDGQRVYAVVHGTVIALDAATGRKVAERDLEMEFRASPIWCDGRLYLFSESGTVWLLDSDLTPRARLELDEPIHATPAFVERRIYVRTQNHLVCLGER